jgi:hypothetical protein
MTFYRQCHLSKGTTKEVVWIPEKFAKTGKYLLIKDSDGWRVDAAYGRRSEDYLLAQERYHLNAFPSLL